MAPKRLNLALQNSPFFSGRPKKSLHQKRSDSQLFPILWGKLSLNISLKKIGSSFLCLIFAPPCLLRQDVFSWQQLSRGVAHDSFLGRFVYIQKSQEFWYSLLPNNSTAWKIIQNHRVKPWHTNMSKDLLFTAIRLQWQNCSIGSQNPATEMLLGGDAAKVRLKP